MSDEIPDDADIFIGKLDLTVYEQGQTSGPTEVVFGGPVPAVQAFIEHNQDDNTIRIIVGNGPPNDGNPPTESIRRFLAFIDQQLGNAVDMRIREDPLEALFEAPAHDVPAQPMSAPTPVADAWLPPSFREDLKRKIDADFADTLKKLERDGKLNDPAKPAPITFDRLADMKATFDRAASTKAIGELFDLLIGEFEAKSDQHESPLDVDYGLGWHDAATRLTKVRDWLRDA